MGELQLQLVAQSLITNKYNSVIDTVISTQTQETDDNTVMLQMTAMSAQHNQEIAAMQAQMQQCYLTSNGAHPPPLIIGGNNNTSMSTGAGTGTKTTRRPYQQLRDGPEGTG